MQNLSDEDIDKLFKQAAEQQQPKFDSADWDDMASRLNAAAKRPWSNYYTWTGGLVILGVVIWLGWMIGTSETTNEELISKSTLQTEATVLGKQSTNDFQASSSVGSAVNSSTLKVKDEVKIHSASSESNVSLSSTKTVSENAGRIIDNEVTSAIKESTSSVDNVSNTHPGPPLSSTTYANVADKSLKSQENNMEKSNDMSINATPDSNQTNAFVALNTRSSIPVQNEEEILTTSQINPGKEGTSIGNGSVHQAAGEPNIKTASDSADRITIQEEKINRKDETSDQKDSVTRKSFLSRLAVKVTVAPDFSSDQFKTTDKMGLNYGLVVEYFLIDKLSVSAGAIWSRKYYSSENLEYNNHLVDRVYGDCRMWDIPVNVNYYFAPSKNVSFFASAGLSSYLMKEENYDFEIDTNYGPQTYSKKITNENNEWFKTLNVSIGLQKQINTRLVVQVEPFMKVPLAGVGEGNISLASFGSFFSLRYHFLSKLK